MASPRRTGSAGALRWLADAYARYAHLVISQLQALEQGDLDRLADLAAQRQSLAGEIDGRGRPGDLQDPAAERLLDDVRQNLQRAAAADSSLRRRLAELRAASLDAIGEAEGSADRVLHMARSYAPPAAPGGRLDVSL